VNAAAYLGLKHAAEVASRTGRAAEAAEWTERASNLRQSWNRKLESAESDNERTYICGLHPAWIVNDPGAYLAKLTARRRRSHDAQDWIAKRPLWTYFTVAEAHQWLLLGKSDEAWNDLEWLWANQASPGLWTWWEGEGEENTFNRWPLARGWVRPAHVTPHYWTAAEMALLQLDMLAATDDSGDTPKIVIGPGIPKPWLDQRLRVEGLSTRWGPLTWDWRPGRLTVTLRGSKVEIVPGPAFPPDATLRLRD
jgi:hypothetical protein